MINKADSNKKNAHQELIKHDVGKVDLTFVAKEAGDIEMTEAELTNHSELKNKLGGMFYVDLVFTLSNKQYPPDYSEQLWQSFLRHKECLTGQLGRNPGISVAAHDYLSNIKKIDDTLSVIPEEKLSAYTDIAIKDGLTSLYDHATFQAKLDDELSRFYRNDMPVSLIMLDIDHFKRFNDSFGHQLGDKLLSEMSRLLVEDCRDIDMVCRYGGEEFCVILPGTSSQDAYQLAERLRLDIQEKFKEKSVTASFGIATCPDHAETKDSLVGAADKALYRAKNEGRNTTRTAAKDT